MHFLLHLQLFYIYKHKLIYALEYLYTNSFVSFILFFSMVPQNMHIVFNNIIIKGKIWKSYFHILNGKKSYAYNISIFNTLWKITYNMLSIGFIAPIITYANIAWNKTPKKHTLLFSLFFFRCIAKYIFIFFHLISWHKNIFKLLLIKMGEGKNIKKYVKIK